MRTYLMICKNRGYTCCQASEGFFTGHKLTSLINRGMQLIDITDFIADFEITDRELFNMIFPSFDITRKLLKLKKAGELSAVGRFIMAEGWVKL